MPTMSYRPRDPRKGKTRKVSFSVSESTIQGLDKIRNAFHRRYPQAQFPTLSSVLEKLMTKDLKRLSKPEVMAAEIADFERRYPISTKSLELSQDQPSDKGKGVTMCLPAVMAGMAVAGAASSIYGQHEPTQST